ncbi:M15 family metallopeptidase [Synechococcus sp. M16CYN]|uniref:M15 family metallopeptidase n=1 Tax=Synechococcus sp. M16CYN TaxID=3103139 RepID=UPI0032552875
MRPWSNYPIQDCLEPLEPLPKQLFQIEPHPYVSLGAPYGFGMNPFCLRSGVVKRLLIAQNELRHRSPDLRLAIFDAWRPMSVQAFMVNYTIDSLCNEREIRRNDPAQQSALNQVLADVDRFWATPNNNPNNPPPHSTGAAIDLTLVTYDNNLINMGGAIDTIGVVSEPDYFAEKLGQEAQRWHQHRRLLASVMAFAGFVQHPGEWWHYSHGDQLWAWRSGTGTAIYGELASN